MGLGGRFSSSVRCIANSVPVRDIRICCERVGARLPGWSLIPPAVPYCTVIARTSDLLAAVSFSSCLGTRLQLGKVLTDISHSFCCFPEHCLWVVTCTDPFCFTVDNNIASYPTSCNASVWYFFHVAAASSGPGPPRYGGFTIPLRHITFGRTPLDEWSARCWDFYLTTHNIHKTQTSMPLAGFEPVIPASERPHTHALHRAATEIG
jgi:hypothetical protein